MLEPGDAATQQMAQELSWAGVRGWAPQLALCLPRVSSDETHTTSETEEQLELAESVRVCLASAVFSHPARCTIE